MATKKDNLTRYREKRDFTKTPEPEGILAKKSGYRYLIHKHAASRLHYDFRLELDGTLKSWAVTRGPSLDPHEKRLAVEVEDHPVSYGSFEGTIPKGEYGGGTVMLWDEGTWEPIGDPRKGLEKGKLEFRLFGSRLQGEWTLVRMRGREKEKGRSNWLLIKHQDAVAKAVDKDRLLTKNITSITSGRSMEEIAAAKDAMWSSKKDASIKKTQAKSSSNRTKKSTASSRKTIPMPAFIKPQLATLTDTMPKGENWVHEIKFDGYRTLCHIAGGNVRMHTRTGLDWTHKFQSIADAMAMLPIKNAIFDGEIVALNNDGISSFGTLQQVLSDETDAEMQYYVFDILLLDGEDMKKLPLIERKKQLETILEPYLGEGTIFYSEHFQEQDDSFLKLACRMHLEGVISKRSDATYRSGRGTSWLKTKCHQRQEFVIGGFTLPTHKERGVGALLLGYAQEEEYVYAGKVGTGFDQKTSRDLRKKLDALAQSESPFAHVMTDGRRGAHWVAPKLVCEVQFTEWTADGHLRHPSFQGLREDKPAKSVHRDSPIKVETAKKAAKKAQPVKAQSASKKETAIVEGITITHPERIIYPGTNITKLQVAEYYAEVADHIMPFLKARPLSMVRCPEGIGKECFFQRHIAHGQSEHLFNTGIEVKGRNESYMMIKDVKGLISLVQWGCIEMHPWGALADKPDKPDRMIFDLDPDPTVSWKHMVEAALEVRERMREFGLESFLKTTGGKGLHVTIPMTREYSWPTIKAFTRAIAESLQNDNPKLYISTASKAARKGKIFVDYLRNDLTSTAVVPYSARAREGAGVATPIAWEELTNTLKPFNFTIETVPQRLQKLKKDPWAEFFKIRQKIPVKYLKALKVYHE